jgi:radical SAM superfamily enzyme YgiQ (UPF0313 family)
MKILLVDPPFKRFTGFVNFYYPMGLGYLAAVLRNTFDELAILDVDAIKKGDDIDFSDEYRRLEFYKNKLNDNAHEIWKDIRKTLADYDPDLVGITTMTTKFGSVLKTARIVKKHNPELLVVVGGPHATLLPEQTLTSENIDIVVRGEGERTVVELTNALKERGLRIDALRDIKGISYRWNGKIVHNPSREFIKNLDEVPLPARDLLMYPRNYTSEDMGAIMAFRGCPFHCSYCCHPWGNLVRHRSAENVIREMKQVKSDYGTRQFEFKDDTFTVNKRWVLEFCERLISERLKVNWSCTTRADLLNEELVRMMKKAGCNVVKLGIETGSERILKETKKGITIDQVKRAAKLLNTYGMFWSGYFMMGLPTETEEDIRKTYEFMKALNPHYAGLGVYNPFPKTDLFDQGVKLRLLNPEIELRHFFNTNPKDYFFIDPAKRVLAIEKKKFDKLTAFMMDGFHEHNTQLKNIIRRAWARKKIYLKDWRILLSDMNKAIKWKLL